MTRQRPTPTSRLLRRLPPFGAAALVATVLAQRPAHAEAPRFQADVERTQVTVGDAFVFEVTLGVGQDQVSDYRPPDFKGLRVLSASRQPNQSTQMQLGGAGMFVQVNYTWQYQLQAQQKGNVTIGPAHIRVNGHDYKTSPVVIAVGTAGGTAPPPLPQATAPSGPSPVDPGAPAPPEAASGGSFIRLVTDKQKAYVGEALSATWFLYLNQPADKYDTQVEPTMEGFWSEDVTLPSRRGGMVLNDEVVQGRHYQVGAAMRKALFPLHPGRLTIGPMEAQLSRVDFFGTPMRSQRLRSTPTNLEILPLPAQGQPNAFDPANVGTFTFTRRIDRTQVATGEAVTLTLEIAGHGNLRKVALPAPPKLDGWKTYDPRLQVNIDPGNGVEGTKSAEILMLPERPGTYQIPGQTLDYFDPAKEKYEQASVPAIAITVTGGALAGAGGAAPASPPPGAGLENVIAGEIRPIHTRGDLRRNLGASFVHSGAFAGVLFAPPLLFVVAVLGLGLRDKLSADTGATRRRRSRKKVQAHLTAAEQHRRRRDLGAFYNELDRVVREALSHRLGLPAAGLRMDELREHLGKLGLPDADTARVVALLEDCDRARFAPGSMAADDAALGAALERAGEVVAAIEGAPGQPEGGRA